MFKKGVITDEISQEMKVAVELASRYKLDGVEIRSVWEKGPHELDRNDISNIKKIVEDAGMKVCGISSPFYKCNIDNKSEIGNHHEILKRCIELAQLLGTEIIRGFTFWKKGELGEYLDNIVDLYEKPLKILEGEGITLVLENEPSVFTSNAHKTRKVIEAIDSPLVKAVWDPGNGVYDPEGEVPFPDGYNTIKPYMVHMHLKDAKKSEDGKIAGVPIGEGQVGYAAHFKEIAKDGYNGYVVLETHYRPKYEIDDNLLALPKGSSFSHLGYEASEECLQKWERLLDDLT